MLTVGENEFDALGEAKTQVLTFNNAVDFSKRQRVVCLFIYREL